MKEKSFFLQPISREIWESKYQLKDKEGNNIESSIYDTFDRVASTLAKNEKNPDYWYKKFYKILSKNSFIGAGRIISNAGAEKYKQNTSLINCTVMNQIPDSMEGIMDVLKDSAKTLQRGSGVGYDFSTIRPKGAMVRGVGSGTSGPLSFMEIYDKMCFTIQSAGGRRGAQMGVMDCQHPDIELFIKSKRVDGKLRQFNLSILITHEFMKSVIDGGDWDLWFWERSDLKIDQVDKEDVKFIEEWDIPFNHSKYRYFRFSEDHVESKFKNISSNEIFYKKVYKTIPAQELWNMIMESNYNFAEPGFILIDEVNNKNNLWWIENIRATNPCGEQPLPPNGACLLGSMVLPNYVKNPFKNDAYFDMDSFEKDVEIAARMLDNVVEYNGLPLEKQVKEIFEKRRHGMGYTGLGNTFTMLKMRYGSQSSIELTERITKKLAEVNYLTGIKLGEEKGIAPILQKYYPFKESYVEILSNVYKDEDIQYFKDNNLITDDKIKGTVLHAASKYFDNFSYNLRKDLAIKGSRYTHSTSIAPSGTISLISNNVSNGIEPPFMFSYLRNVIVPGQKTKVQQEVYDYSFLKYKELIDSEADINSLPEYFISSQDITPSEHIKVQAAAQKYIDTSISKTINVTTDYSFSNFKNIYIDAYKMELKGVTTFRYNPNFSTGVLVDKKNIENTEYEFTLNSGRKVRFKGDDKVVYDGQEHVVSNLFEALKEGNYGAY